MHVHTFVHAYVHVCGCMCSCLWTHVHMFVDAYAHICACMCTCLWTHVHTFVDAYAHVCGLMCSRLWMHVHMFVDSCSHLWMHVHGHVGVRGQLVGIKSVFPPCRLRTLSSGLGLLACTLRFIPIYLLLFELLFEWYWRRRKPPQWNQHAQNYSDRTWW